MAIPTSLLIGLNAMRVLGVLFLLLALDGRLAGPFPFSAGLGDIITGVFAIPLALTVAALAILANGGDRELELRSAPSISSRRSSSA